MTANAIGLGLIRVLLVLPVTKLEITKSRSLVPYPRYWARVTNRHSLMGTSGKRRSLMGTSGNRRSLMGTSGKSNSFPVHVLRSAINLNRSLPPVWHDVVVVCASLVSF